MGLSVYGMISYLLALSTQAVTLALAFLFAVFISYLIDRYGNISDFNEVLNKHGSSATFTGMLKNSMGESIGKMMNNIMGATSQNLNSLQDDRTGKTNTDVTVEELDNAEAKSILYSTKSANNEGDPFQAMIHNLMGSLGPQMGIEPREKLPRRRRIRAKTVVKDASDSSSAAESDDDLAATIASVRKTN
jgi:hypothetical protein